MSQKVTVEWTPPADQVADGNPPNLREVWDDAKASIADGAVIVDWQYEKEGHTVRETFSVPLHRVISVRTLDVAQAPSYPKP